MEVSSTGIIFASSGDPASGTNAIPAADIPLNTWNHIAFTKTANTGRIFLNGILKQTYTYVTSKGYIGLPYVDSNFVIGSTYWNGTYFLKGYIDELRISDVCRYTEDFTPPTEPFSI